MWKKRSWVETKQVYNTGSVLLQLDENPKQENEAK